MDCPFLALSAGGRGETGPGEQREPHVGLKLRAEAPVPRYSLGGLSPTRDPKGVVGVESYSCECSDASWSRAWASPTAVWCSLPLKPFRAQLTAVGKATLSHGRAL